jgi:MOSC domain-containing protein YiiM
LLREKLRTRLRVGCEVVLQVSKIGKECHQHCAIYQKLGDCAMPREGVFARVVRGGVVRPDDEVHVEEPGKCDDQ